MPAVLRALQGGLETMYRVETELDVCDFLVGGEERDAIGVERAPREQLLIKHDAEGLQLGLFVDERTLENLAMRDPRRRLDGHNLQDFLYAVEGVSHFVYLVHRARQERPVSAVELELQAEVDKYLVLRLCLAVPGRVLVERLFDHFRLHERLSPGERERYRVANQVGRRYARWFDRQVALGNVARALDDARALYRKPFASKLEHIDRAA